MSLDDSNHKDYEILPDDNQTHDSSFKIIVIGDSGVGKSCLTMKATKNIFETSYSPTIGFEFYTFNVRMNEKVIRLQIWDTCGQEVYRSLINGFYRNSSLAILVYAIDSEKSFKNLDIWLNDIKTNSNPDVKIFLIGNKQDLDEKRKIPFNKGKKFSEEHKLHLFKETSAKTGYNAQEIFVEAAHILYEEKLKYEERALTIKRDKYEGIQLPHENDSNYDYDDDKNKKRMKCCIK